MQQGLEHLCSDPAGRKPTEGPTTRSCGGVGGVSVHQWSPSAGYDAPRNAHGTLPTGATADANAAPTATPDSADAVTLFLTDTLFVFFLLYNKL